MGRLCKKYGVIVISDEIHCDFAFDEHPHIPFLMANPDMAESTVICTAPSKSFNLAGLQTSNIWIPGEKLREQFQTELNRCSVSASNVFGLAACQAAYTEGEEWLDQCRAYMRSNLDFVRSFLAERLPQIKLVEPDGTYFAWLDCTELGMDPESLNDMIKNEAKLWLDEGGIFGSCAAQFQRVVLACPRTTVRQALERLEKAVTARIK